MSNENDDPASISAGIPAVKRLNLHIPSEMHRRIKVEAASRDQSITEMVLDIMSANLPKR